MINLDSVIKSRDIILPNHHKGPYSQSYGISSSHVKMWELTVMKAEYRRTDAFELWCWRRVSRVPWTARRPNQSILKEINLEYSLEGLMLKLKLQYLVSWFEESQLIGKDPDAGKDREQPEKRVTEDEMIGWHHWFNGHASEQTLGDSERQGSLVVQSMGSQKAGHDLPTEQQQQCASYYVRDWRRDFPCDPVDLHFQCRGLGFDPWSGK